MRSSVQEAKAAQNFKSLNGRRNQHCQKKDQFELSSRCDAIFTMQQVKFYSFAQLSIFLKLCDNYVAKR